ncbi:MAG: hypothetical protein Q9220_001056 [cf. Caloplaca sp. 1 TL-2023]
MVWPRDKKQKGAHTWGRFKDVLTGRGPDMYVNKQGETGPHRTMWSGWGYGDDKLEDNMGYADNRRGWPLEAWPPSGPRQWRHGYRPPGKVYDFNKRKYTMPHDQIWSDVKWDRKGRVPLFLRNRYGQPHYSNQLLASQTHAEWALGLDPIGYNPQTAHWDYYLDELPLNWNPRWRTPGIDDLGMW